MPVTRGLLQEAIGKLLGGQNGHRRLVVLVDDLDRCSPESAYKLLEGIKVYLSIPGCVFVLAMDRSVVELAVSKQIGQDTPLHRTLASEYLEKICSSFWSLPLVREPATLLTRWLPATC